MNKIKSNAQELLKRLKNLDQDIVLNWKKILTLLIVPGGIPILIGWYCITKANKVRRIMMINVVIWMIFVIVSFCVGFWMGISQT